MTSHESYAGVGLVRLVRPLSRRSDSEAAPVVIGFVRLVRLVRLNFVSAAPRAGHWTEQLQATLDALPYSASRILAVRIDGRVETVKIRSEPKQKPPYRPLGEVIKAEQVVHALHGVHGTLIAFRFPAATSSVNVAGWHFHFLTSDKTRGGHVLDLTTGAGQASLEEIALRISFPAQAPAASASAEAIRDVERPQ